MSHLPQVLLSLVYFRVLVLIVELFGAGFLKLLSMLLSFVVLSLGCAFGLHIAVFALCLIVGMSFSNSSRLGFCFG